MPNFNDLTGTQVDGYRLDLLLSQESTGAIFRAWDLAKDCPVVMKLIRKETVDQSREGTEKESFLQRAQAAMRLSHSCIARIISVGQTSSLYYICIEDIDGRTLAEMLAEEKPLEISEVTHIFEQVLAALDSIHNSGLFHGSLDPSQIKITEEKKVFLIFCPVRALRMPSTLIAVRTRFVSYNSPEQVLGLPLDIRSDIFSLGAILYHALTGKAPFEGGPTEVGKKLVESDPISMTELNAGIPERFVVVCRKALAKDPARRYRTPAEMLKDLDWAGQTMPVEKSDDRDSIPTVRIFAPSAVKKDTVMEDAPDPSAPSAKVFSEEVTVSVIQAHPPAQKSESSAQSSPEEPLPQQKAKSKAPDESPTVRVFAPATVKPEDRTVQGKVHSAPSSEASLEEITSPVIHTPPPNRETESLAQSKPLPERPSFQQTAITKRPSEQKNENASIDEREQTAMAMKKPSRKVFAIVALLVFVLGAAGLALFHYGDLLSPNTGSLMQGTPLEKYFSRESSGTSLSSPGRPPSESSLQPLTIEEIVGPQGSSATAGKSPPSESSVPKGPSTIQGVLNPPPIPSQQLAPGTSVPVNPLVSLNDTARIGVGMTSEQVRQILGSPWRVKRLKRSIEWEYRTSRGLFEVRFRSGTVIFVGFFEEGNATPAQRGDAQNDVRPFDRIGVGMTANQVRSLLGEPDRLEEEGNTASWNYNTPRSQIVIDFKDNRVTTVERR